MAKVSGPLFSVDARGKISESIIFGGWRGIKTVRSYAVPNNPQTAIQSTSRGFFASGVALYHTLSDADKAALRVAAIGHPYSGFNMFVSGVKSALDQGLNWVTISGVSAAPGSVVVSGNASSDVQLKISYGLTTALTEGEVLTTPVDGAFSESFPAPLNFEKLHYRVEVAALGHVGFSGVYPFVATDEEPIPEDPAIVYVIEKTVNEGTLDAYTLSASGGPLTETEFRDLGRACTHITIDFQYWWGTAYTNLECRSWQKYFSTGYSTINTYKPGVVHNGYHHHRATYVGTPDQTLSAAHASLSVCLNKRIRLTVTFSDKDAAAPSEVSP